MNFLKVLKNIFLRFGYSVILLVMTIIFPRSRNLVIFGSKHGNLYCDNSKYLFEWILKNRPEIKCLWLTRNSEIEDLLKKKNIPCLNMYSLKGRLVLRRALVGVISHSLRDLVPEPTDIPGSIKLIQLFHGQCVKAVRFGMNEGFENNNEAIERRLEAKLVSYGISTSEFMSNLWEKCMEFGREKYVITGFPRNDCLIKVPDENKHKWKNFLNGEIIENTILYAPTYRPGKIPTTFFPFPDYSKDLLLDLLESTKTNLLLRPHLTDLTKYKDLRDFLNDLSSNKRIKLATHKEFADINTLLPFIDVLITDYSSIYHDFLLLNKPMIFFPYDYDQYNKRSGFLYDYFENLPGPSVSTFKDFSIELCSVTSGSDNYAKKRAFLAEQIHEYSDANSCERASKLIENLL